MAMFGNQEVAFVGGIESGFFMLLREESSSLSARARYFAGDTVFQCKTSTERMQKLREPRCGVKLSPGHRRSYLFAKSGVAPSPKDDLGYALAFMLF